MAACEGECQGECLKEKRPALVGQAALPTLTQPIPQQADLCDRRAKGNVQPVLGSSPAVWQGGRQNNTHSWMTDSYLTTLNRRTENAMTQMHMSVKYSTTRASAPALPPAAAGAIAAGVCWGCNLPPPRSLAVTHRHEHYQHTPHACLLPRGRAWPDN